MGRNPALDRHPECHAWIGDDLGDGVVEPPERITGCRHESRIFGVTGSGSSRSD